MVALDGEGLRLARPSNGATRLLPYGADADVVVTALVASLGPPLSRGTNADCGAGPVEFVTFDGGLSVVVQKARFVGWSTGARSTSRTLTTMSGIGVGATRAGLDSVHAAVVSRTSLGVEFAAGGVFGVLDGEGPSARITDLWSGTSCVAR